VCSECGHVRVCVNDVYVTVCECVCVCLVDL
jgi:hypothetical protein